jgi:hypothetical protein
MLSRRELIGKAAVGATAALAVSAAARAAVASTGAFQAATSDTADGGDGRNAVAPAEKDAVASPAECDEKTSPPPWHLLTPLAAGSVIAHGWRLADLSPVQDGACVVTLRNARGRLHRIHVCRNDGTPQGIVYTRRVDLVVMNEGRGDLPTEEKLAQAVAELAHVIAANEARLPEHVVADLLPHAERLRRFAATEAPLAGGKLR